MFYYYFKLPKDLIMETCSVCEIYETAVMDKRFSFCEFILISSNYISIFVGLNCW